MNPLPWFKCPTDLMWDDELEHLSDCAFRTLIEIVAYCQYHLTDGVATIRQVQKHCGTRRLKYALGELSNQSHIILTDTKVELTNPAKWLQMREKTEQVRSETRERVRAYRKSSTSLESKSKSKSKKPPYSPPLEGDEAKVAEALSTLPEFTLDTDWMRELLRDYPNIDWVPEIKRCRDWWSENEKGKKRNWKGRIRNWFGKAQERAGPVVTPGNRVTVPDWY